VGTATRGDPTQCVFDRPSHRGNDHWQTVIDGGLTLSCMPLRAQVCANDHGEHTVIAPERPRPGESWQLQALNGANRSGGSGRNRPTSAMRSINYGWVPALSTHIAGTGAALRPKVYTYQGAGGKVTRVATPRQRQARSPDGRIVCRATTLDGRRLQPMWGSNKPLTARCGPAPLSTSGYTRSIALVAEHPRPWVDPLPPT